MDSQIISFNSEAMPPLYGLAGPVVDVIVDIAVKRQVPVDFPLAAALAAMSAAIGSRASVKGHGYTNRLNLWLLIISPSGTNKSQTMKDILEPVREIDRKLYDHYIQVLEAARRAANEAAQREGRKAEEVSVPKESLIIADTTPEGMYQALNDNPHGILQVRDEFAAYIGDMGRYTKSGEASQMLSVFDGDTIKINRKSQDLTMIERPYLSLIGGIQPGILDTTFGNRKFLNSGFLQRFLIFYPLDIPIREYQRDAGIDLRTYERWSKLIKDMYGNDKDIILNLDADAEAVYALFFNRTSHEQAICKTDYERSVWAKLQIIVLKLAALASLSRSFAEGIQNLGRQVTGRDMSWAVDIAYYAHATQMRVGKIVMEDDENVPPADAVTRYLLHYYPNVNKKQLAEAIGIDRRTISRHLSGK